MMPVILVRADAGVKIGTGHIMRTLTLSKMLKKEGFGVIYLTKKIDGNIDAIIVENGFDVINLKSDSADEVAELINRHNAGMIIFDHYGINSEYERKIKESFGVKVFCFDDTYEKHCCDILLNQNIYAKKEEYSSLVPKGCEIMAGMEYALLRDEFKNIGIRENREVDKEDVKLLVTLGGSDEKNVTLKIIKIVDEIEDIQISVTVIAGKANPNFKTLEDFSKHSKKSFNILKSSEDMANLMNRCDIAITAGGSTTLEILYLRVPSITVMLAENQRKIVEELNNRTLSVVVGDENEIAAALKKIVNDDMFREGLVKNMKNLFKNSSSDELLKAVKKVIYKDFKIAPALYDDCMPLFELANDETVRKNSFSHGKIELENHKKWLKAVLADKNRHLFAVKAKEKFLGQVRFDRIKEREYLISLSIVNGMRGLGLSADVIMRSIKEFFKISGFEKIVAEIKKENRASIKSFEKAGFSLVKEDDFAVMEYKNGKK